MLTAVDPVTWRPRRITIAGSSGSGKSTFAQRLAGRFELAYVELDSLFHGAGWQARDEFVSDAQRYPHVNVVRLTSHRDTGRWIDNAAANLAIGPERT